MADRRHCGIRGSRRLALSVKIAAKGHSDPFDRAR
jgi:hypothetical protein